MNNFLGKNVKDKITGFEGIVTSYCTHLTGCDRLMIEPISSSGNEKPRSEWLDIDRIEIVENEKQAKTPD